MSRQPAEQGRPGKGRSSGPARCVRQGWVLRGLLLGMVLLAASLPALPEAVSGATGALTVSAQTAGSVTVTLSDDTSDLATTPEPTVTLDDISADFGTMLEPSGVVSDSTDAVTVFTGSLPDEGACYVWAGAGGAGLSIHIKSNMPWNGSIQVSENTGTSGLNIAGGSLRYVEGTAPTSYADGCVNSTAFDTSGNTWKSNNGPGDLTYSHWYALRVRWSDVPGTFSSTVTYVVSAQ